MKSARFVAITAALSALAIIPIVSACASIMGVEDPVLSTSPTDEDGGLLPLNDGGGDPLADGAFDPDAGCVGEGCPCANDDNCMASTPYNKCVAGACVECTTAPDSCAIGRYCLAGVGDAAATADGGSANRYNACAPGCSSDDHCKALTPTAPYCDLSRHRCVSCKSDNDCKAFNQGCSPSGVCTDKCGADSGTCPNGPAGETLTCCNQFCVDTTKDVLNCGACGGACGNQDVCCGSSCKNTLTDVGHCGACGNACNTTNNTPSCNAGSCKFGCTVGFSHCPADSTANDGCGTASNTTTLCGSCTTNCTTNVKNANGVACALSSGTYKCTYSTCNGGFDDCNNSKGDGCECACGKKNQACCDGKCESGNVCVGYGQGQCAECGDNGEYCCSGNKCNSGNVCVSSWFGTSCRSCRNNGSGCSRDSDCCGNDCHNGSCR